MPFLTSRRITLRLTLIAFAALGGLSVTPVAAQLATGSGASSLPKTAADAVKWLKEKGQGTGQQGLSFYLGLSSDWSADVVRVMLVSGASATKPLMTGDYALSTLATSCDGQAAAAEIGEVLLQAGANVNAAEPNGRKATPAMAAVMCPALLKVILSRKPNLNVLDANEMTAMDYAIRFGKPREEVMRLMMDAGFDLKRWRATLLENYSDNVDRLIESLSAPGPAATAKPAAANAPTPARPAATTATSTPAASAAAAAINWKSVGPYPSRTAAEATHLLARPGTDITKDEHLWDAITRREPQRLALAIQAGASVKQLRAGNNYTPLLTLAEGCDLDRDVETQVSIAEQLIAAGAEVGVQTDGWTPLIVAADDCPIGVIHALVKAGSPLGAAKDGNTALKLAILDGRADVVDALLDAGLDPRKEPYNVGRFASGNKAVEAALKKKRK